MDEKDVWTFRGGEQNGKCDGVGNVPMKWRERPSQLLRKPTGTKGECFFSRSRRYCFCVNQQLKTALAIPIAKKSQKVMKLSWGKRCVMMTPVIFNVQEYCRHISAPWKVYKCNVGVWNTAVANCWKALFRVLWLCF